jgi:hypothetical protein
MTAADIELAATRRSRRPDLQLVAPGERPGALVAHG